MIKEYTSYIKDNPEGYWFKRKLYGWGWTPATHEGWFVIAGYLVALLILAYTLDSKSSVEEALFSFFLPLAVLTGLLIGVCFKKGEKPRWQWGIPKK